MLDTNRGTDLVLEHHSIHVTHVHWQYRFPQAHDIKQHPLQYFCVHSTYQYVPCTYLGKIVCSKFVLWVNTLNSTYEYRDTGILRHPTHLHSLSESGAITITLANVTSLLPTLASVQPFAGSILPI